MIFIINKNWRILAEESTEDLFLLPYIHLLFLLGFELSIGWMQFSITLSYSSDKDNEKIRKIRDLVEKGGDHE